MGVSVDGSEVIIQLDNIASNVLPEAIRKALEQSCLIVEGDAKVRCPVDSGQLRQSINHKVEDRTGQVSTNVEYAPYVEIGTGIYSSEGGGRQTPWVYQDAEGQWHRTSGGKPHPFMKPALEQNTSKILNQFEDLI